MTLKNKIICICCAIITVTAIAAFCTWFGSYYALHSDAESIEKSVHAFSLYDDCGNVMYEYTCLDDPDVPCTNMKLEGDKLTVIVPSWHCDCEKDEV